MLIEKASGPTPVNAPRYAQLLELIRLIKPETILEIGTWNGFRAMQMSTVALKYNPVKYIGYDLFEDANDITDTEEKNVKPHYTKDLVSKFLREFQEDNPHFSFELHRGNTRETLKESKVDFAYIDGGHSVETIRSDYEAVKESKVIVFDDYYSGGIDTELYGANKIVDELEHVLLPVTDPVYGGGGVQLAMVVK